MATALKPKLEGPFTIQTPNREFEGKRANVFFTEGTAIVRSKEKRDELVALGYEDVSETLDMSVQ